MSRPLFRHKDQNRDVDIPDYVFYEYHRYVSFSMKQGIPVLPKEAFHNMSDSWGIAACIRAWCKKRDRDARELQMRQTSVMIDSSEVKPHE